MFGERLRKIRRNRKLTQEELAEITGVSKSTISMYESGKREPDFETLGKIAECLGVSQSYFFDKPYIKDNDFGNIQGIYDRIKELGKRFDAKKILLFGSRARGDNREKSDIDIAVFGMGKENQMLFAEEIDNLPTLLDFDIVFVNEKTDKLLSENIRKDGITLMNKREEKLGKLKDATKRLEEALSEYEKYGISSARDGVIQRFEFCTELAWKSAREYLLEEGYTDINSPKAVMKEAYSSNLIDDEKIWVELLYSRNLTSHIYDEDTASEIYYNIRDKYTLLFKKLIEKLEG